MYGGLTQALAPRSPERKEGYAIHVYTASASMDDCCLGNADGDLLIVPQQGACLLAPVRACAVAAIACLCDVHP